ncbi:MAG: hypothetical protein K2N30_02700, partial [Clostridia bacterium]|nr:hypothetical protein [Clostridia bacterium]
MKKRLFALVTLAVLCAFGLSYCALAENCQANCNHIYGFEKRREATCKLDGAVYHECIKCHYTETIERIPKIAHSYNVTWKKTSGCIGFKSHGVCSSCNETDSRQISFGSIFNSDLCYYHDYDFENPVSVTADESDPDCVLYEYRCKNPDCTDGSATITIHGWNDVLRSWYEENKDSGLNQNKYFMCKTCNKFADAYTLG